LDQDLLLMQAASYPQLEKLFNPPSSPYVLRISPAEISHKFLPTTNFWPFSNLDKFPATSSPSQAQPQWPWKKTWTSSLTGLKFINLGGVLHLG